MAMLSVEEAQARILAEFGPLGAEELPVGAALGRVLAHDLVAGLDLPPFANSSMDGYALRAADLAGAPVELPVIGEAAAGRAFVGEVAPGTATRIFTGAPVPPGADAVLQQEATEPGSAAGRVRFLTALTPGTNIRAAGGDLRAGTVVARRGVTIGAAEVAAATAIGLAHVAVARRPRVAVVATGDELVEPGRSLGPGQIYNSNAPMIAALVTEAGGDPIPLPLARDTAEDVRRRFLEAAATADLIVTSGGVSVGDYDLVRVILAEIGQLAFWRVNVRPGKPLAYGRVGTAPGVPIFGLPGNPVSSAVTFELFARPAIRALLGAETVRREHIAVRLGAPLEQGDRRHYVRARLEYADGQVVAYPLGDQSSHRIASLLGAAALVMIPEGAGTLPAGAIVTALSLR